MVDKYNVFRIKWIPNNIKTRDSELSEFRIKCEFYPNKILEEIPNYSEFDDEYSEFFEIPL